MQTMENIKRWVAEITEIALLIVALGIVVEILFGSQNFFGIHVVTNLTGLITSLGENGVVGLVALGVIIYLFNRRQAVTHHHNQ